MVCRCVLTPACRRAEDPQWHKEGYGQVKSRVLTKRYRGILHCVHCRRLRVACLKCSDMKDLAL